MARKIGVVLFAVICLLFAGVSANFSVTSANAAEVAKPTKDGNDIIFPDSFIRTVPRGANDGVWIAFHDEDRFEELIQEGDNWRAKDAVGKDVHPYVGDPFGDYKPTTNYCKIEQMGWRNDPNIVGTRGRNINIRMN